METQVRSRARYLLIGAVALLFLAGGASAKDIKLVNCTGRRIRAEAHDVGSGTLIPASNKQIKNGDGRWLDCSTVTSVQSKTVAQCLVKIFKLKEFRDDLVAKRAIFRNDASYRGKLTASTYVVKTADDKQKGTVKVTEGSSCD